MWRKILDCYSLDVDFSRNTAEQQWQSWGRPWRAKKWSRKSGWSKEPGFVRTSTSTLSIHQFVSVSVLVNFQVFLFALSGWSSLFVLNEQNMNLICVIKVSCTMYVFCPKILGNGHLNNEWMNWQYFESKRQVCECDSDFKKSRLKFLNHFLTA